MAKYIFLNIPAHGHVNPTLAVVQELVARGDEVLYYVPEEFRQTIEATGATFRPYESMLSNPQMPADQGQNFANSMPFRLANESAAVLPQVLESIREEQPDCVLYNMMCLWGRIAAQSLHIPAVLLRPTYALGDLSRMPAFRNFMNGAQMGEFLQRANAKLAEVCQTYSIPPFGIQELFSGSEPLTLVFIPREFQPGGDTLDERLVFVGPAIQPRPDTSGFPLDKLTGKTTLYISLGTVFNNQADFFNMCFEAFEDKDWQVVLARGKKVDPAQLHPTPANFLVAPYVPQLDVLQHAHAFVTHSGMNSTMESLYYGVPMVALPQMPEQMMTAQRIQELGLGIELDKNTVTVETLRTAVERVMDDPTFRTNAQEMQQKVRNAGGYKKAADAIEQYVAK